MRDFVAGVTNPATLRYHYDRLARSAWQQIEADDQQVKVKRYCYALRPALMLRWLATHDDLPPMDVASLCSETSDVERSALERLFALKLTCDEADMIDRQAVLDSLIRGVLAEKVGRPPLADIPESAWRSGDDLFASLLDS